MSNLQKLIFYVNIYFTVNKIVEYGLLGQCKKIYFPIGQLDCNGQ